MVYELSSLFNTYYLYYFKEIISIISLICIVLGSQLHFIDNQASIFKVRYIIILFDFASLR
jgi:hypothetical protein